MVHACVRCLFAGIGRFNKMLSRTPKSPCRMAHAAQAVPAAQLHAIAAVQLGMWCVA
jgi:hypothetical protein